jgi:hypothetical protein
MRAVRDLPRYLWTLVCVVCLAAAVLTIYDWVCDNLDVVRMAEQEACEDEDAGCHAHITMLMRTPITQSFELATVRRPRVYVRCTREWILLGAYRCKALDPAPGSVGPAATAPVLAPPGSARKAPSAPPARRP